MKIIEFISQLGSGGAERFAVDLSNELAQNNEVILCISNSIDKHGFYKNEISPNVKVICLNKKSGIDFSILIKIYNLIRKEKPDIVHTHLSAIIYILFSSILYRKAKYFHTIHNTAQYEYEGKVGYWIRKFLFKHNLVNAITISPDSMKSFIETYHQTPEMIINGRNVPSNILVSNNVVNEFKEYRKNENTKVIVQLAHVGHQKRQNIMANVITKLNNEGYDVAVLMIGAFNEEKMVEEIRSLHNENIYLLGPKHNPLEYLKLADAFGLCSSYEGLPISLIEALGVGLIPICTPVGGIVDVIKDGINGFLSQDISEEAYYTAMKRYLDASLETINKMKKEVIINYQTYSMTECSKKYTKLFKSKLK